MSVQLFARQQNNGEYVSIDLFESDPIKLNLSVANIIDPTATNSVFSRSFRVPNTNINNRYFEGVFNVNSINFDAAAKADAYILANGIFFENGNIRLNAINVNSKEGNVEYEITFYGSTSDFGSKIGGGFLNEVNLNKYNHSKDYTNITASWDLPGLFDGDVVYGLIEWGYTYNDKNQPSLPTLSTNFAPTGPAGNPLPKGSFTNQLFPYRLEQWKPQIRAKALWDQIFEEAGYTYDSVFLDSDFFKRQYIISDNQAQATLDNSNNFEASNQQVARHVLNETFPWITPIEASDSGNNYNPTTGIYTAPAEGVYEFKLKAAQVQIPYFSVDPSLSVTVGWQANIMDVATGTQISQQNGDWNFNQGVFSDLDLDATLNAYLMPNQAVRFEFRAYSFDPSVSQLSQISYVQQETLCVNSPNIMSFNGIMPSNIRKIDFMKSIINKYRLVFVPSKFEANHFTIVPWKDWILEGRSKDWSSKLDTSKDMVIKPLFFDQARFQIYKDQEDSDYLNYNYQLGVKQTFGQLNLDSTNELIKGTKEYKDQFAPTPLDGIGWRAGTSTYGQAAKFLIPHMAKDSGGSTSTQDDVTTGKREPIQPKLRLVFYNGMRAAPITWYMATDFGGVLNQPRTSYPLMSQYSEFPVTPSTFDLNWQNQLPLWDIEEVGEGADPIPNPRALTSFSCFNVFWKTWYDITFDPYSRLVEANFTLDYNEVLDLKFNDYIFVKDAWYFVNSVTDFIVGQTSNCKVQLIKLGNNAGITLPDISPIEFLAVDTCYHPTSVCSSHCCFNFEGAQPVTIYVNGDSLVTSTFAYIDNSGGILAAPGFYTDASGTVLINENGAVTEVNTSSCDCVPDFYTFTVHRRDNGCDVCCNDGPLVTVYGAQEEFEDNNSFYSNTLLTEPSIAGFYKPTGSAIALQVGANGNVLSTLVCDTCLCVPFYSFTVCASTVLCDACCCVGGTSTVWGINPTFASNTILYTDNAGGNPVANGFYKLNDTTVAEVTGGAGAVTVITNCNACPECDALPVTVEVVMFVNKGGYVTTTILQKSYDNGTNWVDVGTSTINDPDDNISSLNVFTVEEGVRLRAINSSTVLGGTMNTNYKIDLTFFDFEEDTTPASRTVTIPSSTIATSTYQFSNSVLGGQDPNDEVYTVGPFNKYQDAGWPTGNPVLGSVLSLTDIADINTSFNVNVGFRGAQRLSTPETHNDPTRIIRCDGNEDALFVMIDLPLGASSITTPSTPLTYKGVEYIKTTGPTSRPTMIYKLDYFGNLDTTFFNNFGFSAQRNTTNSASQLKVYDDRILTLANGNDGTLFLNNQLRSTYLDGTADSSFVIGVFGVPRGIISDFFVHNNLIYLVGQFTWNIPPYNAPLDESCIIVLNYNGSFNLTESNKFRQVNPTIQKISNANQLFASLYNNKLYIGGTPSTFSKYGGGYYPNTPTFTDVKGFAVIDLATGLIDTTFQYGPTYTGFNGYVAVIRVDETGIYVSHNGQTYNGAQVHPLVKLNFNGTQNTNFVTGSFLTSGSSGTIPAQIKFASDDNLYVTGNFQTINNITTRALAKLDRTTGALITGFDVNTGFSNTMATFNGFLFDVYVKEAPATPPNPIQTSYSATNACLAFCNTPYNTTIYGNGISLAQSTVLYADPEAATFVATGWYSDGGTIAQVDTNGVIIGYTNINTCNCGNLFPFEVQFSFNACTACGFGTTPDNTTVYGTNRRWSQNQILYANSTGADFANPGWYSFNSSIALQVVSNGNVSDIFDCSQCGVSDLCAGYLIQNTSGMFNTYTYTVCGQSSPSIYNASPGEVFNTGCIVEGSFNAEFAYGIINIYLC